jgi:predicted SprT family Zn-dependent metalloprotease
MPKLLDGDCQFNKGKFIVRIEKQLPEFYAIEVLAHELAHVLAWDKEGDVHGPHWGKAYSQVYRKLLQFTFDPSG